MDSNTTQEATPVARNDEPTRNNSFVQYDEFNYAKAEPVLVGKGNGKGGKTAPAIPEPSRVPYESVDDMGTNDAARTNSVNAAQEQKAPAFDAAKAGVYQSVSFNVIKKLTQPEFEADPNFDIKDTLSKDQQARDMQLTGEELDAVKKSKSIEEYTYNLTDVEWYRHNEKVLADHPVIGISAAMLADSAFMVVPMATPARASKSIYNAVRIASNVAEVSAAAYTQGELGQSELNTYLVGGFALADSAFAVRGMMKASALGDVPLSKLEREINESNHGTDISIDPDSPQVPVPVANIADDIEVAKVINPTDAPTTAPMYTPTHPSLLTRTVDADNLRVSTSLELGKIGSTKAVEFKHVLNHVTSEAYSGKNAELVSTLGQVIANKTDGVKFRFIKSNDARPYTAVSSNGNTVIHIPVPRGLKGNVNFRDALNGLSAKEASNLLHEGIHAATANTIAAVRKGGGTAIEQDAVKKLEQLQAHVLQEVKSKGIKLPDDAKYHLNNVDEFIAGIANSPDLRRLLTKIESPFGNEGVFRSFTKAIMQLLGIKPKSTAFSDAVDSLHDLLSGTNDMAMSKAVPQVTSKSMKGMEEAAKTAYLGASPKAAASSAATGMLNWSKEFFKNNFMLSSQIGKGNAELAETLFGNPLLNGVRKDSVVDYKRLYQSVGSMQAAQVENAIYAAAKEHYGINFSDQFFSRRKFRAAVVDLEQEASRYLHAAHDAHVQGANIPVPSDKIKGIVDAYVDSNWAKTWRDNLNDAGLGGELVDSPYYLPVRYSPDRVMRGLSNGDYEVSDIKSLISQVVKDNFQHLPNELQTALANKWARSLTSDVPNVGATWKIKASQGTAGQLTQTLRDMGIDDATVKSIVDAPEIEALLTNTTGERSLKRRNQLDYNKEYTTPSGLILKLDDIIDHSTTRLMERYNARMSGRAALAHHGYADLSTLSTVVNDARRNVPTDIDVHKWSRFVDESIDAILGNMATGEIPDALRAAGSISNAMVLKNSGIYGLTDTALSMYELGFSRVLKGMMRGGMWRDFAKEAGSTEFATRFHNVLNGAMKNDMRFKLIHNFAEDNTELTHVANYVNVAKNFGNSVHTVNGLRMVHSGVTNLNSGIVYDMFMDLFTNKGMKLNNNVWEATGSTKQSLNTLRKYGLRDDLLTRMRDQHAANAGALFDRTTQQHLELVGQRVLDNLLQQTRLGEVSHFASLNPIGRAVVGYLSFSLGATTRILGRMVANKEYAGLSMLMAYQLPLMLMASYTKAILDGKTADATSGKLIMDSVSNMGMLGGLGVALSVFSDQSPRNGLAMLAAPYATAQWLKQVSTGSTDLQQTSRVLPLVQTFIPLRAVINNLAD